MPRPKVQPQTKKSGPRITAGRKVTKESNEPQNRVTTPADQPRADGRLVAGGNKFKFAIPPFIPVALSGWYPTDMTTIDYEWFDYYYLRSVSMRFAVHGVEPFVYTPTFHWGKHPFRWPAMGASISIMARFSRIQINGQKGCRLVDIVDAAVSAVVPV